MDSNDQKRRKCGPRVKTGCITCRIRRVKCDETKPDCERCTSTGRKCDGYVQPPARHGNKVVPESALEKRRQYVCRPDITVPTTTSTWFESDKDREFFHFYCAQSALDLSVYLDTSFWYNMILQFSEHYPVIRQAVVALGASHSFTLRVNAELNPQDELFYRYEQAKQYDKAIRTLRKYLMDEKHSDPRVVLTCCALFFSCENDLGNREAALQHLERGLSIINAEHRKVIKQSASEEAHAASAPALQPPTADTISRRDLVNLDDELVYVFSRLDCQATLCQDGRGPALDLDSFKQVGTNDAMNNFHSVTDAQRALDVLHNRLAKFLTSAGPYKQTEAKALPPWVVTQKNSLSGQCAHWELAMNDFIQTQLSQVQSILARKFLTKPEKDPDWQIAIQIQLLVLHHRCWWMLFRSSYPIDLTVFTMSPNPRACEVLDVCEFLGLALPVRPSSSATLNEADMAWKLISEVGIAAPLFVLATKCTDLTVYQRAKAQLEALRGYRNGRYDRIFLSKVIYTIDQQNGSNLTDKPRSLSEDITCSNMRLVSETASKIILQRSPPLFEHQGDESSLEGITTANSANQEEPMELLGWGRRFSVP